ncbi:ABC-F family ATP-binding cassette domain-containing protein [Spirillospora sp. NPDC048911]|uniref:ABC-F family ATP-binding cassette domain-containing protein n=1 Tax=Spirillospora sp. NPDC048911 TaxID=3364527 RepID=UPI003713C5F9
MGHIDASHVSYHLPDGRRLLDEISFQLGEGAKGVLVGPNGAGKSTLLRIVAGAVQPDGGAVAVSGEIGVMRQFVGGETEGSSANQTVRDLLVSVAPRPIREAVTALDAAERDMRQRDDEAAQMRYAHAINFYADAGGYEMEVTWDGCATAALGLGYDQVCDRKVGDLSGGEQKRLVLEALLGGPEEVLLLDEPDNYLDVPTKQWLENRLRGSTKTVLMVSHDRHLIAAVADKIITVEQGQVWVHGGGYAGYGQARRLRNERLDEVRRRWDEEHAKLKRLASAMRHKASYNSAMAPSYQAARSRLRRFEEAGAPEIAPKEQTVKVRLRGGRTGKRVLVCEGLQLAGLVAPFDLEVRYGERVALLGGNGTGKSHLLRLLAGEEIAHTGSYRFGSRVTVGHFSQVHARSDLHGRSLVEIAMGEGACARDEAMSALSRYELAVVGDHRFEAVSGGQQARLQILLLELSGATLLLLDEPTDNLDLASAEALQIGLSEYTGTVLCVTHDRWFAADFDRFLVLNSGGEMCEVSAPVWDSNSP